MELEMAAMGCAVCRLLGVRRSNHPRTHRVFLLFLRFCSYHSLALLNDIVHLVNNFAVASYALFKLSGFDRAVRSTTTRSVVYQAASCTAVGTGTSLTHTSDSREIRSARGTIASSRPPRVQVHWQCLSPDFQPISDESASGCQFIRLDPATP